MHLGLSANGFDFRLIKFGYKCYNWREKGKGCLRLAPFNLKCSTDNCLSQSKLIKFGIVLTN